MQKASHNEETHMFNTKHKPTCAAEAKDDGITSCDCGATNRAKEKALLEEACHALRELMCRGADDAGSPEVALAKAVLLRADAILYK